MPIRRPHIGKAAVHKRHVEDALKFTVLDHIVLCRGAGVTFTGNAGTTYAALPGSGLSVNPARYSGIRKVEVYFEWNPETTAGGMRVYNETDASVLASSEPGAVGWRLEKIDITDRWKALTSEKYFRVDTKGDGTTAPTIAASFIVVECGNV